MQEDLLKKNQEVDGPALFVVPKKSDSSPLPANKTVGELNFT